MKVERCETYLSKIFRAWRLIRCSQECEGKRKASGDSEPCGSALRGIWIYNLSAQERGKARE